MALTRKYLQAMGLEEDKIDSIISAHTEVTDALKKERDSYKEAADKLPNVEKELETLKSAANEGNKDTWKVKYEALKEEHEAYKAEIDAKQTADNKIKALKAMLREIGVSDKRIDTVAKVTNLDDIKLDSEGKVENSDTLKESLKTEWSDFITTDGVKGANVSNPPSNTNVKKSKEEIMQIKDTSERQKAIAENHELFGF